MKKTVDIPGALQRLATLISQIGYECEIIDQDELFVFPVTITNEYGDEIAININVTANGENKHIGTGNYIAFEVFIPCAPASREEELQLCYYVMQLIMEVDITTIQYVPKTQQILISRVDCIDDELPDDYIIDHIIRPTINEIKHIFTVIESPSYNNEATPSEHASQQYLN